MSQSNDSPAPCADKEEHGKSTTSVCGALFAWSGSTGTSTLASHITRAHPSVHSELMVAGASSQESREARKNAVMITGEGWCFCPLQPVFCFHVQVRTAATPALAWRY